MPKKGGITLKAAHIVRRKSIDSEKDPYLSRAAPMDMALCSGCGSVYHGKRWYRRGELPKGLDEAPASEVVLCPACQKTREGYARGFVTIEGSFVEAHAEEIMNLIGNKGLRQLHINPLERVMDVRRSAGRIEVQTTTEKLAQRIGQILKKAYHGEVSYKWSDDTKLARVVWRRDEP